MFSNALPYGPRNERKKNLLSKSSKKNKKSASRLNSSALSMYSEQSSGMIRIPAKENMNNVSLNSYWNVPFGVSQYKTLNNSVMESRDFEMGKMNASRNRASKGRIKTTSTNSNMDADKLLEGVIHQDKGAMTGQHSNARSSIKGTWTRSNDLMYNFKTVDVTGSHGASQLSAKITVKDSNSSHLAAKIHPLLNEGKEYITLKKFPEAIEKFTKALEIDSNHLEVLFYRGVSYLDCGKPREAIKDLRRILSLMPDYKKLVYLILSIAYKRIEMNEEALNILWKGLRYFPKFSDIYLARAHIYLFLKQYEHALKDFRSFNKYAHKKTAGLLGEGDALKKLGQTDKAIEWYSKIVDDLKIRSESTSLYWTAVERRALTHFLCKNYDEAKSDFDKITNI
jgi:tetratricopeptide (TPR) repeat protein